MKKMFLFVAMTLLLVGHCWAGDDKLTAELAKAKAEVSSTDIEVKNLPPQVSVRCDGKIIEVAIMNPSLTKEGGEGGMFPASEIMVASGILDAYGKSKNPYFPSGKVKVQNGKAAFQLPSNILRHAVSNKDKAADVEHLYGIGISANGESGFLVLNPDDPWVVYDEGTHKCADGKMADLKTLAIGIVIYPDGTVKPLKSLGLGKLKQGPHPELK